MATKHKTGKKWVRYPDEQPVKKPLYQHLDVHNALLYIQDALERALIPFVLLDDIAKQIHDFELPNLEMTEIDIGVMRRYWTRSGREIFNMWVPEAEIFKNTVGVKYNGVPIVIWIIEGDYVFFKNPDVRFYTTEQFNIPNPFDLYWKERNYIK